MVSVFGVRVTSEMHIKLKLDCYPSELPFIGKAKNELMFKKIKLKKLYIECVISL